MTVYRVQIEGREYRIEISDAGLTVDGELIDAELQPVDESGLHLLRLGGEALELHVHREEDGSYAILRDGQNVQAIVAEDHGQGSRPVVAQKSAGEITAPMPGVIVNIAVSQGDTVTEDQVLVVMESMKMQMEIRAPFAGAVLRIPVTLQARVEKGDLLIQLEAIAD